MSFFSFILAVNFLKLGTKFVVHDIFLHIDLIIAKLFKDSEYFTCFFLLSHFSNHHSKKFCEIILFIDHPH